ncbi:class I SAM-dependent methyltransferase [Malonomonas rubra]|uniref:class I SAM-dependent methyltransferase n=1 Tax=Malonomonas rubra TaxID=57040 RepID=UPI0026ED359C|nr:class I SAM-dependent methyltransferase [Malonomonas rubra]
MSPLEFAILALTFVISLSIVWNSLRVGITPVPSSKKARQTILQAAEAAAAEGAILELGCGWGHLALLLAQKYPHRQVIGYEVSLFPWLFSLLLKRLRRADNLLLLKRNFLGSELPPAALAICYLHPGGMTKLAKKLREERPQIDMLISNTFALPDREPLQIYRLKDIYKSPIYVYRLTEESDVKK